jgi:hypothetical protein
MKTTRLPLLLVAAAACSERPPQLRSELNVGAAPLSYRESAEPVLVRNIVGGEPHFRADTLAWADSTLRGDTTFLSRGRAISTTAVVTDSLWIRVAAPVLSSGIPFGLMAGWKGTDIAPGTEILTMTYASETPATLLARIASARSRGIKMVTVMTGGARAGYLTSGVFDRAKWQVRMNGFNTPAIRAAVAQAVSEGILIGNSVMDEPFNAGGPGNEANSWGPAGTMTKARVDSLCGYAKAIFPTLPQGVFQDYGVADDSSYRVCDFIVSQYRITKGPLTDYRDGALALCRRDRHACAFAINILDGGIPAKRSPGQTGYAAGDCPLTTTGGRGTYFPNCRMTAQQVREAGRILGIAGCFLTGFRYDSAFMANPSNQQAFQDVVSELATRPETACIRT